MDDKDVREIRIDLIVPTKSVLISTARGKRPRKKEAPLARDEREHVETCPFCRDNENQTPPASLQVPASGDWDIRIVENPYPMLDDEPIIPGLPSEGQQAIAGYGYHEVVIDHPNHGIILHQMSEQHLALLFAVYRDRMQTLYETDPLIKYVLIFKNFGKAAGASIPHSHSQIVAMPIIPHDVQSEIHWSQTFYQKNHTCIYCALIDDALALETKSYNRTIGEKSQCYETTQYVIEQSEKFVAIKPYASRYEWEVHILPKKHQSNFIDISDDDLDDLAFILRSNHS
ncbi:MAG: DUF4921 family protein [Candidatus Electrothrix sp. ATG1]|nr:DUF4921 family protein [Candidatus Electrothrix sp. ATG1]